MFVSKKVWEDLKELSDHRAERITYLERRLAAVQDELDVEKLWAEGEIEFWQEQCFAAEELNAILLRKNKYKPVLKLFGVTVIS